MGRPVLPPVTAGVCLVDAARLYEDSPTADGIFISSEIVNDMGYRTLILRTMPNTEVGTCTFDLKVQAYDDLEATWYDIAGASLAQITADRTTPIDLVIGPYTAVANRVVSQPLPHRMRVHVTLAGAAEGFTFGVSYELHN
jgi:hypothetical protein